MTGQQDNQKPDKSMSSEKHPKLREVDDAQLLDSSGVQSDKSSICDAPGDSREGETNKSELDKIEKNRKRREALERHHHSRALIKRTSYMYWGLVGFMLMLLFLAIAYAINNIFFYVPRG